MNFGALVKKTVTDAAEEGEHRAKKEAKKEVKSLTKDIKKEAKKEVKAVKKDLKHEIKDVQKEIKEEVQAEAAEQLSVDIKELKHDLKDVKKEVKHETKKGAAGVGSPSSGNGFMNRFRASLKPTSPPATPRSGTATEAVDKETFPPLPAQLARAEKEGWLTKQGQKVKSWRDRWFKLDALSHLHYYKNASDTTPLDSLWLEGAELRIEDNLKRVGFNFSLLLIHPKPRMLYLSARSSDERDEWMEALLQGIRNAQSMLSSSPRGSLQQQQQQQQREGSEDDGQYSTAAVDRRESTWLDLPDVRDEGSDDEEAPASEAERALLAKTLLSKSMWGPADLQALEQTGILDRDTAPVQSVAFASWYGVVGLSIGGTVRKVVVADASEGTFAWCHLRLRGRINVIGKEEALKTDDQEEQKVIQQTLVSPVKQLLCEDKEGWMFYVYVSPTEKQAPARSKKARATISMPRIKMAADTKHEMESWAHFLWNRGLEGRPKQMINGFLWIRKAKSWQRYYCIANAHYFEWFEPQKFRAIPLTELTVCGPESARINRPKQKSPSFHLRSVLDTYNRSLMLADGRKNMCLYLADDEHFDYWDRVLSRRDRGQETQQMSKEMLGLSCAAIYAKAAVGGSEAAPLATPPKKGGLMSEQGSAKVSTRSPLTDLINSARLLCEQANQATGKTPLGNYSMEGVGSKDGHYRILSLDGGGLRAVMEAVILARLMETYPDLLQKFDLIAGVSGGSMVTAGLATGRSPQFLTEMFKVIGPICFKSKAASVQWFSLNQAKFPREPLEAFGAEVFKGMKLRDLPRRVLITSFLLDNEAPGIDRSWEPRIYHNLPLKPEYEKTEGAWKDQELWKCVLSSSAAPIYFPSHGKHMDGAVMVNNPALTALTMVMSEKVVERQDPSRVHLLSLGTGRMVQFVEGENLDWGMLQWAPKLPELIVKAGLLHQEAMVGLVLGERFHQCNPLMERFLDMDNPAILPELIELAASVDLTPTLAWIERHLYHHHHQAPPTAATTAASEPVPVPSTSTAGRAERKSYAEAVADKSVSPPRTDLSCDLSAWYSAPLQVSPDCRAQED